MKKTLANKLFTFCVKLKLGHCGSNFHVKRGTAFYGPDKISIGSGVRIGQDCDFYISPREKSETYPLKIGDGCHIGHRCAIAVIKSVIIEDKVMIGNDVYFADHGHQYEDPNKAIIDQSLTDPIPMLIKTGSWIGAGSTILPGVNIGEHSVVGAGSVVTKTVEDYTVVVGNPARVIKRYDPDTKAWLA